MARRGISQKIASSDRNLKDALETLALDHDVISSVVTSLIGSAAIPPGISIVAYSGGPSKTLTLPPANALGANVGALVFLLNLATVAVTVVPSTGNTLNATTSLSVAAAKLCILASDGNKSWLANT